MKRMSMRELVEKVEAEGLDYMLMYYMGPNGAVPLRLADAWLRAGEALLEIEEEIKAYKKKYWKEDL